MGSKVCNKCGIEKPLNENYYYAEGRRKDGFTGRCRECIKLYNQQYRKERADQISKQQKQYNKDHAEHISEQKKQYNKDNVKQAEYRRQYKKDNIEYRRQYLKENAEHFTQYSRQYRIEHAEQKRIHCQHRRALKRMLPSTLTISQWESIKQAFNNECCYCGKGLPLAQDHFIPLSKGGEYTTNNIIPSCKSCNTSKYNRDFFIWYPKYRFYSKKRETIILKYLNYKNKIQQLTFTI